jgi:hypothetical protein
VQPYYLTKDIFVEVRGPYGYNVSQTLNWKNALLEALNAGEQYAYTGEIIVSFNIPDTEIPIGSTYEVCATTTFEALGGKEENPISKCWEFQHQDESVLINLSGRFVPQSSLD